MAGLPVRNSLSAAHWVSKGTQLLQPAGSSPRAWGPSTALAAVGCWPVKSSHAPASSLSLLPTAAAAAAAAAAVPGPVLGSVLRLRRIAGTLDADDCLRAAGACSCVVPALAAANSDADNTACVVPEGLLLLQHGRQPCAVQCAWLRQQHALQHCQ